MTDPYKTLGLRREASAAEIKSAYRKLAKKHHPDVNPTDPGAGERFKQMTAAYTQALLFFRRPVCFDAGPTKNKGK